MRASFTIFILLLSFFAGTHNISFSRFHFQPLSKPLKASRSFLQLQIHAISVTLDYQLLDSHLWQTPLFYSMTIMSIINIGLQGLVYFLILIGWILVAGTFILCAIFLFLHKFGETKCYFSICGTVPKVQFEDSVLEALLMLINLSGLKNLLSL
ncbi:uncharacterized protein LOC108344256 isoform X3 [Vigna angularis]|uniref:uncharacterized protein LOC108344256 isoform X3 n=1 Tax=Phaseolus angularis TaxID=3914 RepID=UPI0022B58376|nr:uncharacterized protein LOC108344256 isoform X3 [Vigna angularis]